MLAHWKGQNPEAWPWLRPILESAFTALVMISFGRASLEYAWRMAQLGGADFESSKDLVCRRISTVTVVAGFLVSFLATLITTIPPVASIISYTERGPYLCLSASFGALLGVLIQSVRPMFS
ncbi:hypothetical protein BC835DRAFT_546441 [Cytidiella melzeri]|nr:hypothetical protein BC835DRAFT_546441 [Cytidiella melzeri]